MTVNIRIRTLTPGPKPDCRYCGRPNTFGHDEVCTHRRSWKVARNEALKHIIAHGLRTIPGQIITLEPKIRNSSRRNDIRVELSILTGSTAQDYDIRVAALASHASSAVREQQGEDQVEMAQRRLNTILDVAAMAKRTNLPADPREEDRAPVDFYPLIFSAGGMMEKGTEATFGRWKMDMGLSSYMYMIRRLGIALGRARAKIFDLRGDTFDLADYVNAT